MLCLVSSSFSLKSEVRVGAGKSYRVVWYMRADVAKDIVVNVKFEYIFQ